MRSERAISAERGVGSRPREYRAFLGRAVRYLAGQTGIRQFPRRGFRDVCRRDELAERVAVAEGRLVAGHVRDRAAVRLQAGRRQVGRVGRRPRRA